MTAIARASRPFFAVKRPEKGGCVYHEEEIGFNWHRGMSWQVRQRSSLAMAQAIEDRYPSVAGKILEVSTKSVDYEIGAALSAQRLIYSDHRSGRSRPVENWFQASKQFIRNGLELGPYPELLDVEPVRAKRFINPNLDKKTAEQCSGDPLFEQIQREIRGAVMSRFVFLDEAYPLEPKSSFYDFLYVQALSQEQNSELARALRKYVVFTDIEFNPVKNGKVIRYNTQARACAIWVSLEQRGLSARALESIESFVDCVGYGSHERPESVQTTQGVLDI